MSPSKQKSIASPICSLFWSNYYFLWFCFISFIGFFSHKILYNYLVIALRMALNLNTLYHKVILYRLMYDVIMFKPWILIPVFALLLPYVLLLHVLETPQYIVFVCSKQSSIFQIN